MPLARTARVCPLELCTFFQIIGKAGTVLLKYGKCGSKIDAICTCQRKGKLMSYHYVAQFPYGNWKFLFHGLLTYFIQWIFYAILAAGCEIATLYQAKRICMYRVTRVHPHNAGGLEECVTGYLGAGKIRWILRTVVLDRHRGVFVGLFLIFIVIC